jgi:hypothetical protein
MTTPEKSIIGKRRCNCAPSICSSGSRSLRWTATLPSKYSPGSSEKNSTPLGMNIGRPAASLSLFHSGKLSNDIRV